MLLGGDRDVTSRVWLAEVRSAGPVPVREAVLVEAGTGAVVLHWDMLETAFSEQVWDNANNSSCGLPGCSLARTTGQGPTGQSDVDFAYDYGKDTWDYYHSQFGRDSLDGHGMPMVSTVRYCEPGYSCPLANAFWNGDQMVYGQGFASADDVVAHELTHGVTGHEAHLFYIFQSGALNESLSDIFGEFVDLTNGKGNDSPAVRWLLGEDLSIGAIRSMADPPAFGQPDRMHSPLYYCGMQDAGGVHENSGVTNRLAALLADGGTFNGRTVAGLGLAKAGRLFYDLDANWLTSASDFRDFHDALQASCAGLVGTAGISVADCNQVEDALLASETGLAEPCGGADDALVCPGGGPPALLYEADFENACAGWSGLVPDSGEEWYCGAWEPYGPYATSGVTSLFGLESPAIADYAAGMTSDVPVAGAGVYASFRHAHLLEQASMTTGYDGGVVEYSTDGGASWSDAGSLFAENGYNGTIDPHYGNPLGSRPAFIAVSRGYYSSRLDLSPLSGHGVRLRFRLGTDDGGSLLGWYIDDVRIYSCPPANPGPSIAALSPLTVEAGRPAFRLAVEGSGFVEDSVVLWNGSPRATTLVGPGLLRAEIPASDAAAAGTALVTVSNPAPGGGTSGARVLTISQPCAAAPLADGRTDGALADGDCALESLLPGRRHDVYTFEAAAGRRVALKLESDAFDTILRVMTPDGTELSNDNCSRKTAGSCLKPGALAQTGTYTVTVTSLEGSGRGAYALKLTRK